MKTFPCGLRGGVGGLKFLACTSLALFAVLTIASADLIVDLRVGAISGAGSMADDKTVFDVDVGSIITMQIWAQITAAGTTQINNTFGIQTLKGSIVSGSSGGSLGNVSGDMSQATLLAPYNIMYSYPGDVAELTNPADGNLDLGSNSTTTVFPGYIIFRADPTSGGESVQSNGFMMPTNNVPNGATFNAINDGYEFLLGTADFTVSALLDESDPALELNWRIPAFTTAALKGQRANWTQGNGPIPTGINVNRHVLNGNIEADLMFVGDPVTISAGSAAEAIPEPGTWVALLGGIAVLAVRRGRHPPA